MTEPKFQVGQTVAVLSTHKGAISDCFPHTVVTARTLYTLGDSFIGAYSGKLKAAPPGWRYEVAADLGFEYAEICLREIDADTEYLDTPQTTEVPA